MKNFNNLISQLELIRKSRCGYAGSRCDCKYLPLKATKLAGEQTGCCELRQAIGILKMMHNFIFDLSCAPEFGANIDAVWKQEASDLYNKLFVEDGIQVEREDED